MRFCIGGRNDIAVNVCEYLLTKVPMTDIYAIPGKNDDGRDGYQRSFLKYAKNKGIRIVQLKDVYEWTDLVFLSLEFDRIIKPEKFKSTQLFNIHFSLLPTYKGVYTSALPILHGCEYGGVTFHYMDAGIDTGDIIEQVKFEIPADYKALDLYLRCIKEGTELVKSNIDKIIEGRVLSYPQPSKGSSYFSKVAIDYANLHIDTNATAQQIDRQIRGLNYRPFQLPVIEGAEILFTEITADRSVIKSGVVLVDNNDFIRMSTIDYDILLYKDRLAEVLDCAMQNNVVGLSRIPHFEKYLEEREKYHGWNPLIVAAYNNSFDVVKTLVELGADVNATNYNGTTAIMYAKDSALATSNYATFDYLMSQGANPYKCDNMDNNLFDYISIDMPIYNHIKFKSGFRGGIPKVCFQPWDCKERRVA